MWNAKTTVLILGTLALTFSFYLFGRTQPLKKKGAEATQEAGGEQLNAEILLMEARRGLDTNQTALITDLERRRASATSVGDELLVLRLLSRTWNELNRFDIGAIYAVQVAQLEPNAEAWSIAGTTYGRAFFNSQDAALRRFAAQEAIKAFKEAQGLEPDSLRHALNEATMWIELSGVDANTPPMKGVGMLRDLEARFPDNVLLHMTLGRLSMTRSGDLEKALPRFEKVLTLAEVQSVPQEVILEAHYFLAEIYTKKEDFSKAGQHLDACILLTAKEPELQAQFKSARANLAQ